MKLFIFIVLILCPILSYSKDLKSDKGELYSSSLSGIRDYMEYELKKENQQLYNKLNPKLQSLESNKFWSRTTIIGGPIIGAGLILGGLTFLEVKEKNELGEGYETTKPNYPVMLAGTGIIAASVGLFFLIKPNSSDVKDFIREHNKINTQKPLKYSYDFTIEPNKCLAKIKVNF